MRLFLRVLKYVSAALVVLLLIATGVAGWLFWRAQPSYSGQVAMHGLAKNVNVFRDEHGVPHIFAESMEDAVRALGYIHADERLFQMEMQRRAGAGRLSEILGPDMLDVDKFIRTLGLYRLATQSYDNFSPQTQHLFDAYAEGVNFWLKTHQNNLPPEFLILRFKPERWTAPDSVVWGKLMALQLSDNYKLEILRAKLAGKLSDAQMKMLFPPLDGEKPVTTRPKLTKNGFLPDVLERLGYITGLNYAASNEWVIGGAHTESGKPILANDPHLGLEAPVLWFLARIVTPELSLEGATVPGLPVVLLGQNEHIAWGFTTTGSDVQDLFIETLDPEDKDRYLTPDGKQNFVMRAETIHVHGAPDVVLNVRATRHGPVLSDIDPDHAALAGEGKVLALSFTALNEEDKTSEALVEINRAKNWQDFLDAMKIYQAPPQNIVYADRAGHIGFFAAGVVPIRKNGKGLVPADGASGDYDWMGMIPLAETPQLYDPPAGFAFNANNAIVPANAAHYYGQDWEEPFRAERLQEFFDMIGKHSLQTSITMQADHVSLAAKQLLPYLLHEQFSDARAIEAQSKLRGWDGTMDRTRAEPLIFEAWLDQMHKQLLVEKTGNPLKAQGPYNAEGILYILAHPAGWCEDDCRPIVRKAFEDGLTFLADREGDDMNKWRWGDEHVTTLRHKLYSHLPILSFLSELDIPSSGDFYTLDRGGGASTPEQPFIRTHGGGFRGIYDLGDPTKSRFMIASGESGHLFNRHYGDLLVGWNEVQSITLSGTQAELAARGLPKLVFEPAGQ